MLSLIRVFMFLSQCPVVSNFQKRVLASLLDLRFYHSVPLAMNWSVSGLHLKGNPSGMDLGDLGGSVEPPKLKKRETL